MALTQKEILPRRMAVMTNRQCAQARLRNGSNCPWDEIHKRVIGGDPVALQHLVQNLQPAIRRQLRHAFRRAADYLIDDAVADAIAEYALRPSAFTAAGSSIQRLLYYTSWRNLANAVSSAVRRRAREIKYAEELVEARNRAPGLVRPAVQQEPPPQLVKATMCEMELRAVNAWWYGADARTLAQTLGVADLPLIEQRLEVKRFKDRILKRLERARTGESRGHVGRSR